MVRGWALNPDEPEVRSLVQITIDGNPFLTVIANEYRSDLLVAKLGDGYHAFSAVLPSGLLDGAEHTLAATIAGTEIALQHSPRVCVFPGPIAPASADPGQGRTLPDSLLNGLSVVIATRNNGARMERNLRTSSLSARNLPVEFIVVDWGSTDDTPTRLAALGSEIPHLKSVSIAADSAGAARNKGVAMASRELILFLGDSVAPNTPTFFEQHMNAHHMLPGRNIAVVGKVTWPNLPDDRISFLMSHLQGSGEQQFGFHSLVPYTWLDWRFFYPENVSFKRSVVPDWGTGGYRTDLPQASLLEDSELAFRLNEKTEGGFPILYYPGASVSHENLYSVRQFIERQVTAGLSARSLFEHHAGAKEKLGVERLDKLLVLPKLQRSAGVDDLLRVIEGAKSWGVLIEAGYQLGSQNWHADLLNAVFELSYLQGYVMGCSDAGANFAAAYQYCVERFQEKLSTAAALEVFGRFPSFTLT